ncbi:MAG: hypothetical protein EOO10_22115 [Chitinophagaceae bacterium]|nr:MAG: hypothetical protein EOO10_22115 [Chitinophagaceae bacterium]
MAQTRYSGFIDKYPVELVTSIYPDGEATAIYTYTNFDEPIVLSGKLEQGRLSLFEKDKEQKNRASLTFPSFTAGAKQIEGNWTDLRTGRQLKISLANVFSLDDGVDGKEVELLQPVSLGKHYLTLLVTKSKEASFAKVSGVKILEKKTDRLVQQLAVDCQLVGLNSIDTGDYNFDGLTDFSVFEAGYAGPNTARLYFLFDPKTDSFVASGFTGTSLEFDNKRKRIIERNQCCAGTSVTTAEYKVVQNKMVLVKQQCYKWDEKKQALVERKWKDCQ